MNDASDKLHEAEQLIELIYLAGTHGKETEPFAVGALKVADLLTDALAHLDAAAKALRGEEDAA